MFWKYGLFFSILSGVIWGVFWQIFFTVVGILILGTPLSLELSQIMIIGPLAGILYIKGQKFFIHKIPYYRNNYNYFSYFYFSLRKPISSKDENQLIIFY